MKILTVMLIAFSILPQNKSLVTNVIHIIKIDGAINPIAADYIYEGIQRAGESNAECLIIQLNTPGGLLKSTRIIVSHIFSSKVPVVIYVSPPGSQAASAGVFITLAGNIAAMAPGTNIGAAHPVTISEGNRKDSLDIMMEKSTNDAAAFIRTIAEKHNRNIEWAEKAVRQSVSLTETEALKEKVIDIIAKDMDDLLSQLDGYKTETSDGEKIIHSKNAKIIFNEMSTIQKLLDVLSEPNIAYILLMLGIYGLLFKLYNPGSILPGVVGVISIVLAFYSLHTLPINYAGLALIIFAVILFIAEIKIVSHGLLSVGGIISFLLGSLMLINTEASFEFLHISLSVIITSTVLTALFFIFALGKGIAVQRRQPATGMEGMIGESGIVLSKLEPGTIGQIMLHGEIWNAESEDKLEKDQKVKVYAVNGLKLIVKKS